MARLTKQGSKETDKKGKIKSKRQKEAKKDMLQIKYKL